MPGSPTWAQKKGLGYCFKLSDATYLNQRNRSCAIQWRSQSLMQGLTPESLWPLTWRPFEACHSCIGYSWMARSPQCMDWVILLDHLHVQNVASPTSMRAIIGSGGYLCMTIPTIKARSGLLQNFSTCQPCTCWDPKSPYVHWRLRHVLIHLDLHL